MKLSTRTIVILLAFQLLSTIASTFFLHTRMTQELRKAFASHARSIANGLGLGISGSLCSDQGQRAKKLLNAALQEDTLAYAILRSGSSSLIEVGQLLPSTSYANPAQLLKITESSRIYTTYATVPSCAPGKPDLELEIGMRFALLDRPVQTLLAAEFLICLVQVLIATALALVLGRIINQRISEVDTVCRKLASGDFSDRLKVRGEAEYASIARSVNQMADSLVRLISERDQKAQELVAASKLSSLGEMAGFIAHEINNPLAIIQGRLFQLKKTSSELSDPDRKAVITKIAESLEATTVRIARIVRGLRLFSRNAEADPKVICSLKSIIDDSLGLCSERFKNHAVDLRVNVQEDALVLCQPTQISQVLVNLLNNAFDAVQPLQEKWVEIEVKPIEAARVLLTITDSGAGIPSSIREKLMTPFFTTKPVGKGTGLGLSVSKGILEDHGAEFRINERHPHTQFVIILKRESALSGQAA